MGQPVTTKITKEQINRVLTFTKTSNKISNWSHRVCRPVIKSASLSCLASLVICLNPRFKTFSTSRLRDRRIKTCLLSTCLQSLRVITQTCHTIKIMNLLTFKASMDRKCSQLGDRPKKTREGLMRGMFWLTPPFP